VTTPPPVPPAAAPQGRDRTALWGWLGIIIGLICCGVLGVVFGVLSIQDANRYGKDKTLGYVAIVAGLVNILAGAILSVTATLPWQNN
jgi:ABC-type uncharacterized transport system permease subunit